MSARYIPRSRKVLPRIPRTKHRSTASMATHPVCQSYLEVERKFRPTDYLQRRLLAEVQPIKDTEMRNDQEQPYNHLSTSLSFLRLSDKRMRDTYYDIDGKLASKGIWIRRRSSRVLNSHDVPLPESSKESSTLEAKVRLAGDYTDSQFLELQGEPTIREVLQRHIPTTALESLEVSADLETYRRSWVVHDAGSSKTGDNKEEIRIDLDDVTAPAPAGCKVVPFRHQIGELEMTKEVVGGTDDEDHQQIRLEAAENMRSSLDDFMVRHKALFPSPPKPKGKLEAYYEWKESLHMVAEPWKS